MLDPSATPDLTTENTATDVTNPQASQTPENVPELPPFYLRYYVGHHGKFGHEFLEFELKNNILRYANDSNYRRENLIRKEVKLSDAVIRQFRRLLDEAKILTADDNLWPEPNEDGKQELEIIDNNQHVFFVTSKIGSLSELEQSNAHPTLHDLYYLIQDLRSLVFALIGVHFKIKPV